MSVSSSYFTTPDISDNRMNANSSEPSNDDKYNALKRAVDQENDRLSGIMGQKRTEIEEYDSLLKRLEDLPKKLQHHVMVPFGSVGFMPGKIVRTNEVMMLVGDGYFVERSTFEASEALNRRKEMLFKCISACEAEKKLINDQLGFAQQIFSGSNSKEIEIQEEYDEEKEQEFKNKRRARLAEKAKEGKKNRDEDDILKRLDELELLEQENKELDTENDELEHLQPPPGVSKEDYHKLLSELDAVDTSDDEDNSEDTVELDSDDISDEEEKEKEVKVAKGEKKTTKNQKRRSVTFSNEVHVKMLDQMENPTPTKSMETQTPSSSSSSSILKKNDQQPPAVDWNKVGSEEAQMTRKVVSGSEDAFNGIVTERVTPMLSSQLDVTPGASTDPPKVMSKFKMQRRNR